MCRVRKNLVDDDILEVGANEANEDEVSSDEEPDSDDDLGKVVNYFLFVDLIWSFLYILDERLLAVAQENAKLLVKSLFADVFLMITREEEELFSEYSVIKENELAVHGVVLEQMGDENCLSNCESFFTEMAKFVDMSSGLNVRLKELSDLEAVVLEIQNLDPEVTEVVGLTQEELRNLSNELMSEAENVSINWGG